MTRVSQPSGLLAARERAAALAGARDLGGAQAVLEHAVEVGKGLLGEDDPGVLGALHQLARVHQDADDPMGARRVLEEAYAAGQWRLGDSDPLMLEISYDLGMVAEELGNRHEARKAFGRVASVGAEVLGPDHWAVARARAFLGDEPAAPGGPLTINEAEPYGTGRPAEPYGNGGPSAPAKYSNRPVAPAPRPSPAHPVTAPALEEPTVIQPAVHPRPASAPPAGPATSAPPATEEMPTEIIRNVPPVQMPPATGPREQQPPKPEPAAQRMPEQYLPVQRLPEQNLPVQRLPEHNLPVRQLPEQGLPAAAVLAGPPRTYRKKGAAVYAAVAASLAAVIAVIALVVVLANRDSGDGGGTRSNVPTLGGPAPADVQLADNAGTITVTWTDPAEGKTTFVIEMGRPGEVMRAVGHVGPGETSFRMEGLNDKLDYCFVVAAVYSANKFAPSPQACTSRGAPR
jgi:hypothetical protein